MNKHIERSMKHTVYVFIAFMISIIISLISITYSMYNASDRLNNQTDRLNDIYNIVDRELVNSWDMSSKYSEYTIGEGLGLVLVGNFQCTSETIEVDPWIQFQATLRPEDFSANPWVNVPKGAPIRADAVCSTAPVEFTIPWDQLTPDILHIASPAVYHVDYTASTSTGWKTANTSTNNFIIINPIRSND